MYHIGGREFLIENWLAPMMWEWFLLIILLYLRWEYSIIMFMIAFHQTFIFASQVLAWDSWVSWSWSPGTNYNMLSGYGAAAMLIIGVIFYVDVSVRSVQIHSKSSLDLFFKKPR